MEILIGAEVEMRRISSLHAWLGDVESVTTRQDICKGPEIKTWRSM
jgi:hypothetical protein